MFPIRERALFSKTAERRKIRLIDGDDVFMHDSCMAKKAIALELDAYEKLRSSKRPGESFSAVVRRAAVEDAPVTGASLREYFRSGGSAISTGYLDAVEAAAKQASPPEDLQGPDS